MYYSKYFAQRLLCLLLVCLLMGWLSGCAHQPWDIDTYIQHLESPERDEYQQPEKVVEALNVISGMVVADIGAGSGYFTRRLAQAMGDTREVFAVDVEKKMLDYNKQKMENLGIANRATFILAEADNPLLPANGVDLILLCNTYHHIDRHVDRFYFEILQN